MVYIKINNLLNQFGQPDYKGLDISQFVAGSQIYKDTYGVFATNEDISTLPMGVIIITEVDYNNEKTPSKPVLTLDEIKQNKINEMNTACQNAIINTFQSTAFDRTTIEDYSCELTDQSRINGLVTIAQLRLSNLTTEPINYYKNKEADKCTEWQPKNMLDLGLDLKRHIEKNTNKYEDLKIYINSLNSIEEVQKITWDTVIPTTTT
ncbi:DUF4376 domain-containing protein [Clostridium sp.]|uniref:DUF4376 domain-containing protein n=1 Tax=Clostridium sp. TaxID=1506 RepID=UPI002FDEDD59